MLQNKIPKVELTKEAAEVYFAEFESFLEAVAGVVVQVAGTGELPRLIYLWTAISKMMGAAYKDMANIEVTTH